MNLMSLTDYQAKYFAHELTRRFPPDSVEKVTVAFAGSIDACLTEMAIPDKPRSSKQKYRLNIIQSGTLITRVKRTLLC